MIKKSFFVLLTVSVFATGTMAQEEPATDKYLELLRSDIKTQRVALITEAMDFDQETADLFWPIYKEYEFELGKLGDERVALIKDYADHFENITDEKAKELVNLRFKLDEKKLKLDKKYFKQFDKVLPIKTVVKFFQIENQIDLLIDLQISSALPLIE